MELDREVYGSVIHVQNAAILAGFDMAVLSVPCEFLSSTGLLI